MSLLANTAQVIAYISERDLWPSVDAFRDWEVRSSDGIVSIPRWSRVETQPTESEINTVAISPAFITWLAEHGGDSIATVKREARENIDTEQLLRAIVSILIDELNIVRANLIPPLPNRTLAQAVTAIKNKLT